MVAQCDSIADALNLAKVKVASLEDARAQLKADTARLHKDIAKLQSQAEELNSNYSSLRSNSSSKINKLTDDLQKREAKLREVEEILHRRDEATNALDATSEALIQQALAIMTHCGYQARARTSENHPPRSSTKLFSHLVIYHHYALRSLGYLRLIISPRLSRKIRTKFPLHVTCLYSYSCLPCTRYVH